MATSLFPKTMQYRFVQSKFMLVPVSVLGTSLSDVALVHGSANQLSGLLHNLGRKGSLELVKRACPSGP